MDKKIPTVEVKVSYLFPDTHAVPPLKMLSYNRKMGKNEFLLTDGGFRIGDPSENQKNQLQKLNFTLSEKWSHPSITGESRRYTKFKYSPEEYEGEMSYSDKVHNQLWRLTHQFLINHEDVIVRDMQGNNSNENLKPSPRYELIDETALIRRQNQKNEAVAKYSPIFTDMYKNEPQKFIEFCYAVPVPNIKGTEIEVLYNKVIQILTINPLQIDSVYNSTQLAFRAMINRAIYEQDDSKNSVINFANDTQYYMFNGGAIGKTIEEVYNYFKTNPNAFKTLEQLMGRYIEQKVIKLEAPIEVVPLKKEPKVTKTKGRIQVQSEKITFIKQTLLTKLQGLQRKKTKGDPLDTTGLEKAIEKLKVDVCSGEDEAENKMYLNIMKTELYRQAGFLGLQEDLAKFINVPEKEMQEMIAEQDQQEDLEEQEEVASGN